MAMENPPHHGPSSEPPARESGYPRFRRDPASFPLLDRFSGDHMLVECLDDVIVQFTGPSHNPSPPTTVFPLLSTWRRCRPGWKTSSGTPWRPRRR